MTMVMVGHGRSWSVMVRPNFQCHKDLSRQPLRRCSVLTNTNVRAWSYQLFRLSLFDMNFAVGFWRVYVLDVTVGGFREHERACQLLPAVALLIEE